MQPHHLDVDAVAAPAFGLADDFGPLTSDWHAHKRHQLLYAASGALVLEVASAQWLLPPQRAAWISARTPHRVRASQRVELRTVYLSPRLTKGPGGACRVFAVTPLAREMILHAMRWDAERDPRDPTARAFFLALAALCSEWAAEPRPLFLPAGRTPELQRAMAWTLERLGDSPTVDEAAKAAGLSTRTLARRFADEAATSFREFVATARLLRAMELLAAPGARVTDVALEVGFESFSAFTHAFKAFSGETPRDYRRRVGPLASRESAGVD